MADSRLYRLLAANASAFPAHGAPSMNADRVKVIAVGGGKGGVGKTQVALNLGVCLSRRGQRVALLDADLGLANVDVLLGLRPRATLRDVLAGERSVTDILIEGPAGLKIIPGSSGDQSMAMLAATRHAELIGAFAALAPQLDVLLVDTAAGIAESVTHYLAASREVLLVICHDPASIADAYALVKVLHSRYARRRFRVVANRVADAKDGRAAFGKLQGVCEKFLDVILDFCGAIPEDRAVGEAARHRRALVEFAPSSGAARAVDALADRAQGWPRPAQAAGGLEFFVEQLVGPGLLAESERD